MTEPWLTAVVDQAQAAVGRCRSDLAAARAEQRCVAVPAGCGQPTGLFRDQRSYDEYGITGLCQSCQDRVFAPTPDEVEAMRTDPDHYGRCYVCGEYREIQHVDVGVGVISGFACCPDDPSFDHRAFRRCTRSAGCALGADHVHGCELPAPPRKDAA